MLFIAACDHSTPGRGGFFAETGYTRPASRSDARSVSLMRSFQPLPVAMNAASTSRSSHKVTGLRRALAAPAPQRFCVAHMPAIGHELGYLLASAHGVRELLNEIELQAARRILRKGEPPEVVLASLRRQADKALQRMAAIPQQGLPAWLHHDLAALTTERTRPIHWAPVLEGCAEQPDFFRQGAAS